MIAEFIAFIINICAFVEVVYGAIIWFADINTGSGKVWVAHGFFLAFLATILMIGV